MCTAQDKDDLNEFTASKFDSFFGRSLIQDLDLTSQQVDEINEFRRLARKNTVLEEDSELENVKISQEVYWSELSTGLNRILLPFQIDRLRQIMLQCCTSTKTDPLGILHPEFENVLELKKSQVARLKKLGAQVAEDVSEIRKQLKKDQGKVKERATDEILNQLDYDQRKKFKQLTSTEVPQENLSELAKNSIQRLLILNVLGQLALTEEQHAEFSTFAKTKMKSKLSQEELVERTEDVLLPHQIKIFNDAARTHALVYHKDLSGVSTPWVATELKITRSQLQQIRSTSKPFAEELRELQHEAEVKIAEQREELLSSSHDVLSEDQRDRFIKARGDVFQRSSRPRHR